jgi:thiopeptide-type bacteriocin biosynthesis protein
MTDPDALSDTVVMRCSIGVVADYPDEPFDWGDVTAIARLWSAAGIREAVLLASPALAAQVSKLLSAPDAEMAHKKRKRLHKSLLKYAIRLSTRCTPFGMFAGVTVMPVGDEQAVTMGTSHTRHVRASGAVTRRLLDTVRVLPQARLYPNPSLVERADRLVVAVMRGVDDTHTVASIKATGPARLAVAAATGTATRQDIAQRVSDAYPAAGATRVDTLIDSMLAAEVLLCEAEPSAFDGDPMARVPDDVAGAAAMRAALAGYAAASDPVADGSLETLLQLCSTGDLQRDVHVDLELAMSGQVPASVVISARDAITALTRTMALRPLTPALDEFSADFVERYGNTLVPFLTAVDPELGIGYPRTYDAIAATLPVDITPDADAAAGPRRELIADLLHRTARDGADTVELTDADLAGFPEPDGMPSSFDVFLRLHQEPSRQQATVAGIGIPGGSAVGRFTAVMPSARAAAQRRAEFDAAWWARRTNGRGILCGVDYIAGTDSINEVAATASLYPVALAVNARPHRPTGPVLTLADLYLGYGAGRMRIVLADGAPVSVRQLNMATTRASSKAIQLLREISDGETRVPFWSWGEAEAILNHLPAVDYRGITLAEQRWRYPATAERTPVALRDWLAATGVSRHVRIGPRDNQLLLDTGHLGHLDLLLDEIAAGNNWMSRAPVPQQLGVVDGRRSSAHPAEVVVTVGAPSRPDVEPDLSGRPLHDPADDEHRILVPGGAWTAFAINAEASSHDRILRDFAQAFPELDGDWYYVRYRERDRDQLRVRVQRPVGELAAILAWLAQARLAGRIGDYVIPVYHRELERYGGAKSFPSYERLFCLETAHIVSLLSIIDRDPPTPTGTAAVIRPGVKVAAGVLATWLDALDPGRIDSDEVLDVAVENYSRELASMVHDIKTQLREQTSPLDRHPDLLISLRWFWSDPAQRDAVLTADVLQSASHLLCIRLGMQRHEEFAAVWMVKTERNRLRWVPSGSTDDG